MKRCVMASFVFVLSVAPLGADVTLTQTLTIEGGPDAAAMAGKPTVTVTRIKGMKARVDTDGTDTRRSILANLATKEIVVLDHNGKTAQTPGAAGDALPGMNVEASVTPTGQTRTIEGVQCGEHAIKMTIGMADALAPTSKETPSQLPAQLAEMMKDVRMVLTGSVCTAQSGPGVAEYAAFMKAAVDGNVAALLGGLAGNQSSSGGMDKMFAALASAPGLPYLMEMTTSIEGSGPMVGMMKQLSGVKMVHKTTSVATEPLADELFTVPADYTVKK